MPSQFQTQVLIHPAPAVAGDFASANPRASVLAGPGDLYTGAAGVYVGRFAWAGPAGLDLVSGEVDAYAVVNSFGAGVPTGFVGRSGQALITPFLASNTMLIPQGFGITLYQAGDFWAINSGTAAAVAGQKVYAQNTTGLISTGATGSAPTGGTVTGAVVLTTSGAGSAIVANSVTGSVAGTVLTVTAVGAGALAPGMTLAGGANPGIAPGTTILAQLTGSAGSTGTYSVNIGQTVGSGTITTPNAACFTPAATVAGYFAPGETLAGANVVGTPVIVSQITGTAGGAGNYMVTPASTAAAAIITANQSLLTVTAVASGSLGVGNPISGGSISAGAAITQILTGAGGVGTYLTSSTAAQASGTVVALGATETKWICMSNGAVGELIKISTWPLG